MSVENTPKKSKVEIIEKNFNTVVRKFDDPRITSKINQIRNSVVEAGNNFQRRNRVTDTTIFLMLFVALFYDALQFIFNLIPYVGWILSSVVGFYSFLTYYVWTSIKGWSMSDNIRKWIVRGLQSMSIIPLLNFGPEITMGVLLSILIVKSDDFIYNKTKGRVDIERIKEGLDFFKLYREV